MVATGQIDQLKTPTDVSISARMNSETAGRARLTLQFGLGLGLLVYGIGLLTDVVSVRPPAAVYFVAGIGLLVYGVSRMSQS